MEERNGAFVREIVAEMKVNMMRFEEAKQRVENHPLWEDGTI